MCEISEFKIFFYFFIWIVKVVLIYDFKVFGLSFILIVRAFVDEVVIGIILRV